MRLAPATQGPDHVPVDTDDHSEVESPDYDVDDVRFGRVIDQGILEDEYHLVVANATTSIYKFVVAIATT